VAQGDARPELSVLITGASGFLGRYLVSALRSSQDVLKLGRKPSADIICDLVRCVPNVPAVSMVVHAAGLAHVVPKNSSDGAAIHAANVLGTKNLLQGLAVGRPPQTFVFISSVSVYGLERGDRIDESAPLLGDGPYAKSKIDAEQLITKWGKSHGVNVVILRLPLVVGDHPPGNLGAMCRAIRFGYYFRVGEGAARRSMVLAEDVARMIPMLRGKSGIFHLTDGRHPSYADLDTCYAAKMGRRIRVIPPRAARFVASIGDRVPCVPLNSRRLGKLQQSLTFSDDKAISELGWAPRSVLDTPW